MNLFARPLEQTKLLTCILGAAALLGAAPSYADNCGTSERVSMPQCSRFVSLGTQGQVEVYNLCSQKITVKLDITGSSDKLIDIQPGYGSQTNVGTGKKANGTNFEVINSPTTASCCPRYSACSFPNDKAIADSAPDPFSRAQVAKTDPRFKGFQ